MSATLQAAQNSNTVAVYKTNVFLFAVYSITLPFYTANCCYLLGRQKEIEKSLETTLAMMNLLEKSIETAEKSVASARYLILQ